MQSLFAAIKKIFTVNDNRNSFPEILTTGLQPVCDCCTAGTGDLHSINQNHDVAKPAAFLVFITPAINQAAKKFFMKALVRKSGVFAIALLIANLFFASNAIGQTTYYLKTAKPGRCSNSRQLEYRSNRRRRWNKCYSIYKCCGYLGNFSHPECHFCYRYYYYNCWSAAG